MLLCSAVLVAVNVARAQNPQADQSSNKPSVFRVKYVADGSLYIDAGRNANLQEAMKLSLVNPPPDGVVSDAVRFRGYEHIAELKVVSVADSSAVCEIVSSNGEIKVGQLAFLTPDSVVERRQAVEATEEEQYPIVMTFTYGDPLEEEIRTVQEQKQLRESPVGRVRGRIGIDYGGIHEAGGLNSKQVGLSISSDISNIGRTYWNFKGYWRGNMNVSSSTPPGANTTTLTDLLNRTYQIGLFYQSPYSPVTIGVGRLFLPWAPSLSTIDGGYLGRKITRLATVGFFAGSTPDPSSWSYNPNQHIAGTFVNFEAGDFEHTRFYSTAGVAVTSIQWKVARQFAFFENNLSWKRYMTLYSSLQADEARTSPLPNGGSNPTGISQSYSSLHFQPFHHLGFGVNHNYFRSLPTYDPRLLGTGLLDQYLFQGFSGDVRVELVKHISVYASLGRSKATSDKKNSLNQAFGITLPNLLRTGLLADVHYSKFDSSFGSGKYTSVSLSKNLTDSFRLQLLGGHQTFDSSFTNNNHSNFVNAVADWNVGPRYFVEGNFGWYRGTNMNYQQWSTVFGYRFGGYRK
ncbi:MAG: hypothetical protein DMG54_34970 [Acidobacteria bacterium]|nr:MAG: hypothetical protein DMG54_34970 [Acidobacteriota bacterium]PYU49694.1 MAG: hypothetical protein DMG53_04580 [Acidobacteriota bacterium]